MVKKFLPIVLFMVSPFVFFLILVPILWFPAVLLSKPISAIQCAKVSDESFCAAYAGTFISFVLSGLLGYLVVFMTTIRLNKDLNKQAKKTFALKLGVYYILISLVLFQIFGMSMLLK
jgi:hypothetical protein